MSNLPTVANLTDASTTNAQMKTHLSNLRTYLAELLGTDSSNKSAARALLNAAVKDPGSLLALNGYQRFESGFLIQAGLAACNPSGSVIVTFPTAYTNGAPVVVATPLVASFGSYGMNITGRSATGFSANGTLGDVGVGGMNFHWLAFSF